MLGCGLLQASFCPSIQITLTFYDQSFVKSAFGDLNRKDQEGKVVESIKNGLSPVAALLYQNTDGCESLTFQHLD